MVESKVGCLAEAHGLGFTAEQVSRLIVRIAALVFLHAPGPVVAFRHDIRVKALHGDGTWFCPVVVAGHVAFVVHHIVVPTCTVPVGYLQGYRLIAVPPVVHGGAGVGTALYGGGRPACRRWPQEAGRVPRMYVWYIVS